MQPHLSINDTQATIGEPQLVIEHPVPSPEPYLPPSSYTSLIAYLEERIALLETRSAQLEVRVFLLEQRTLWDLCKAQFQALWRKLRGR